MKKIKDGEHINKDTLRKMYYQEGMFLREIAKKFGCSCEKVRTDMEHYGLERKRTIDKEKLEKLYYEEKMSLKDIGDKLGFSHPKIASEMDKYGLETRIHGKKTKSAKLDELLDKETLKREYHYDKNDLKVEEIAEKYNCKFNVVYRRIEKHGIGKYPLEENEIRKLYKDERLSLRSTAGELGVGLKPLVKKMDKYGIDRRSKVAHQEETPNYNPNACRIIEEFGEENGYKFQHAENGGEHCVENLGYWLDGYDKEQNVAIEYYEHHHKKQRKEDKNRKEEIVEEIGCDFIEIYEQGFIKQNW